MLQTKNISDLPGREDKETARDIGGSLRAAASKKLPIRLVIGDAENAETLELPSFMLPLLEAILEGTAAGNAVSIVPVDAELTTLQAANLLNVSRSYLLKLLEKHPEKLPVRMVGTHRRIRYEDLIAYKEEVDAERRKDLEALTQTSQELEMGY